MRDGVSNQNAVTRREKVCLGTILLWSFLALMAIALLTGCQSPRTSYANGLIVWCSSSAVGIGYGQYIEVPAGGKFEFTNTNSAPCIIASGRADLMSRIMIDNTGTECADERATTSRDREPETTPEEPPADGITRLECTGPSHRCDGFTGPLQSGKVM